MTPRSSESAPPTAIVCEENPRWSPELERQFANEAVRVVACRSIQDVEERSAGVARGVVVLDLTSATADGLRFLSRRLGDPTSLPVFAIGSEPIAELEWPVRELGAVAFFAKRIPGHEMAAHCRRLWASNS